MIPVRLTLLAAAVAAAFVARAAEVEPPPPLQKVEPVERVEIKGAAAKYDARRDDTASKTVIHSEEIQKYGDTSINDVLKRVPGITVGGAAGRSGGEIRMRGLGSGYTQILINGERAPAGFALDTLAPEVIERIEVLRAASAEFSTQSIAGTINIVLKKALRVAQHELKGSVARASTMRSPSASLQLSDQAGELAYSLGANAWRYQYDRLHPSSESGTGIDGVPTLQRALRWHDQGRSQGVNLAPRLHWKLDQGDTLTWQNFFNLNQFASNGHSRTVTTLGAAPEYDRIDSTYSSHNGLGRSDLSWVHKLPQDARLELKAALSASRNTGDARQLGFSASPEPELFRVVQSAASEQGFSTAGKYALPLPWPFLWQSAAGAGAAEHALALGWDAGWSVREEQRRQRDASLPGAHPVNSDEGFSARVGRLALFAQDEWNLTPSWSLYAGLRWEGLSTSSDGSGFAAVQARSSVTSPLLQTLIKLPNQKDQLRLALTRTYKAPSTAALMPRRFTSTNNSPTEPDRRGNPNLKPELALGFDASFEHYWGEGGLLSASVSMRRIDQYTHQALLFEQQRWVTTAVNDGRADSHGLELEAKLPLRALDPAAPALDLRASISRNWSRVEAVPGPDNRLDQQTPLSATLGLDYKSPGGQFSTGSQFSFRNGGPVRITEQQGGYASVRRDLDLYALWKFYPHQQLRVAVANLLAQDYTTESQYSDAGGTLHRSALALGETQLRVTVERRF